MVHACMYVIVIILLQIIIKVVTCQKAVPLVV